MPLISKSTYKPPTLFKNPHFNTIYPALFRKVEGLTYERERVHTPDDDFIDLDWSKLGSDRLVIVLHGLEGSADRSYVKGMIRYFNQAGYDGLGLNHRSCSGEINWQPYSYNMGFTQDLDFVLRRIAAEGTYREVVLVGFSLGGNVILKYLGEQKDKFPVPIGSAIAFSVPVFIAGCNTEINRRRNWLYRWRFMASLNNKMAEKAEIFPEIPFDKKRKPKSFNEFDEIYTAPLHGYEDAMDYWEKGSSGPYLRDIRVPTLLVNAQDDTFLSEECYPVQPADANPNLWLETPRHGGHVGFVQFNKRKTFYSEDRAIAFAREARLRSK